MFGQRQGFTEYWLAADLLSVRGHIEVRNPFLITSFWEDDKIGIEGTIEPENRSLKKIIIVVKIPFRLDGKEVDLQHPFQLYSSDKRKNYTVVYEGDKFPQFFRPGRWQTYLQNVIQNLREQSNQFMTFHNKPIDDSSLFPDIPNPQTD